MEGLKYKKSVFVNARQMSYSLDNYGNCVFKIFILSVHEKLL